MDAVVLALRVLLSLGVVLALLFVLHRKVSKINGNRAGAGLVSVVARQGIGPKASMVVVDAEGTRFYLGVTEQSVSVLHSASAPRALQAVPAEDAVAAAPGSAAVPAATPGLPGETADARFAASLRLAAMAPPAEAEPPTRRSARAARSAVPAPHAAPLQGSILSPATWKQTTAFLRQGRAG
ncbi:FliO/MopB family protein [Arthrobacter sp. NPDC092385]|uniref:FliO/MopB family protein n=1 Tax=Arthrobacter sp. NPDC092385 TaxID=3363943 RepID=UPI0037FA3BA4